MHTRTKIKIKRLKPKQMQNSKSKQYDFNNYSCMLCAKATVALYFYLT